MADTADKPEDTPKKRSKPPLVIGFVLMIALGAAGFFMAYKGLIFGDAEPKHATEGSEAAAP